MEPRLLIVLGAAAVATATLLVRAVTRRVLRTRLAAGQQEARIARQLAADVTVLAFGAMLILASLVVGVQLLAIDQPPRSESFRAGVGIAPDERVKSKPGRSGFVVGLAARFTTCAEPVAIAIAFAGTAGYFEDNRDRLRKTSGFTLALPSRGLVGAVRVSYGSRGYDDALQPSAANPPEQQEAGPSEESPLEVFPQQSHPDADITSVRVQIPDWSSHLRSLLVRFDADWLVDRGLGSCYLVLPPLVGEYSVLGAQAGLNRTATKGLNSPDGLGRIQPQLGDPIQNDSNSVYAWYDRTLEIRNGVAVVDAGSGEVLEFAPPANTVAAGVPGIACSQSSLRTGPLGAPGADLVRNDEAYAIRDRVFASQVGLLDCSATVTLAEADASRQRDLVLLLVGAFVSLGSAVVLEVALDRYRPKADRQSV